MVGKRASVLFENEVDGYWEGYSSNYVRIKVKSNEMLKNEIRKVNLTSYSGGQIIGEVV
jgi:threonylcarbamoyladenosine tRNA methylthiotransferase MtaB